MKLPLYKLGIALLLLACNHPNQKIKQRIVYADSMAINYFKGDGTMGAVEAIKIIRDKRKIEQLGILIAETPVKGNFGCGYDGSLHFFIRNRVVQDIDFRMNADSCSYFYFLQDGQVQVTVLSQEAKELIGSFRKM